MILNLQIACKEIGDLPSKALLQKCLDASMWQQYQKNKEVNIRIVDIQESQYLNMTYRGKNKPTNVLTFPFKVPLSIKVSTIGDIVICHQLVQQEAKDQNKSIDAHWAHMVVHGSLHILGYNHVNDNEAQQMEYLESNIMSTLGYSNPYVF